MMMMSCPARRRAANRRGFEPSGPGIMGLHPGAPIQECRASANLSTLSYAVLWTLTLQCHSSPPPTGTKTEGPGRVRASARHGRKAPGGGCSDRGSCDPACMETQLPPLTVSRLYIGSKSKQNDQLSNNGFQFLVEPQYFVCVNTVGIVPLWNSKPGLLTKQAGHMR